VLKYLCKRELRIQNLISLLSAFILSDFYVCLFIGTKDTELFLANRYGLNWENGIYSGLGYLLSLLVILLLTMKSFEYDLTDEGIFVTSRMSRKEIAFYRIFIHFMLVLIYVFLSFVCSMFMLTLFGFPPPYSGWWPVVVFYNLSLIFMINAAYIGALLMRSIKLAGAIVLIHLLIGNLFSSHSRFFSFTVATTDLFSNQGNPFYTNLFVIVGYVLATICFLVIALQKCDLYLSGDD
jgi:hypothetical protein